MEWVKIKASHVRYDMAGASLDVRWGWVTLLVTVASMERRPSDEELDSILHKDIHSRLKNHLIKTGTTESAVIDKVMEDVESTKYKRMKGKERQKKHYNELHNALLTPLGTGADKIRVDKSREDEIRGERFNEFWALYPKQVGMSMALVTFRATVKTDKDFEDLKTALKNYMASDEVKKNFIKNGDRWLEDWRGWLNIRSKIEYRLP